MGADPRSKSKQKRDGKLAGPTARLRAAAAEVPPHSIMAPGLSEFEATGAVVSRILAVYDGWLRLKPDTEGRVWCKWRYTDLRYQGKYSLSVYDPSRCTFAEALEALENKLAGAYCNPPTHKPTDDVY